MSVKMASPLANVPAIAGGAPPATSPAPRGYAQKSDLSDSLSVDAATILDDTPAGRKQLAALTPADRRRLLEEVKLAPALLPLAQGRPAPVPNAPAVTKGRVAVLLRLNALPPGGLAKLQALGFALDATLTPGKLLLGTIPPAKLDALLALPWVRRVEPPEFKEPGV